MDLGLAGRRAAVAGASRGLGFATAQALAAEGAAVAISGRDRARIEAAAAQIGPSCVPLVCDVGSADGGARFVDLARDALGGVDILVANAGGPPPGTPTVAPLDAYPKALDLNLMSVIGMCHAAVPAMRAQRWGRIVAITSLAVRQPMPALVLSNTARAGATAFLKTLAGEIASDGVTVNTVQPGIHRTDRIVQLYGPDADANTLGIPAGVLGEPSDFGAVVAFVCSEAARFVTGAQIHVDGGAYGGLL